MDCGPILGILSINRANNVPFLTGQSESFAEILAAAEQVNYIGYVFSPYDIDWARQAVYGYRYNQKAGEWEKQVFPLPTVIYNRIPNRTLENKEEIRSVLVRLRKQYGARFYNPFFLDKWETYRILHNNKIIRKYIPDTRRLGKPDDLAKMLGRYKSVYLKQTANSLGTDIFKVTLQGSQLYFIHQSLNNSRREGLVSSCSELIKELPQSDDSCGYLVQQAIQLAALEGRPFDLRLLMQKDGEGKWARTGLAARVAGEGSITTHVFYGGTRLPAKEVINRTAQKYGISLATVGKQLAEIQFGVPPAIEAAYREAFGELEMDIGIDPSGKLWFFEANSKPFRFDEAAIRAKSLTRLMDYVGFLDKPSEY